MSYPINPNIFASLTGPRAKRAKHNIHWAANNIIGGLENSQSDNEKGSPDWQSATDLLENHQELVNEIYRAATTELYDEGFCGWGAEVENALKDIRFLGKDVLMEMVDKEVIAQGY